MRKIHHLEISWSTSRGRDTYGYNICRLDDDITRTRYRTCGGGYDMIGTVLADWFEATYQNELRMLADRAHSLWFRDTRIRQDGQHTEKLYGMTAYYNRGELEKIALDGGCGVESIRRIIEACGFEVHWSGNRKGHTRAYYVSKGA